MTVPHFWLYADTLLPVDVYACLISAMRAAESAMAAEGAQFDRKTDRRTV